MKRPITKFICDFCWKTQDEVSAIIIGLRDVCICDECTQLAMTIVNEKELAAQPRTGDKQ